MHRAHIEQIMQFMFYDKPKINKSRAPIKCHRIEYGLVYRVLLFNMNM